MTDRYGEAVWAAVESDGKDTTATIKRELGIGYNDAARFTERMVADGIISECDKVGRRQILKVFAGCCEPCGAPLFDEDKYATDDNGCTACLPAFHDDPNGRPCYAHRVGGLDVSGIEAASADETVQHGSTEGESPTAAPSGGVARTPSGHPNTSTQGVNRRCNAAII